MSIHREWACSFYEDPEAKRRVRELDLGDVWENEGVERGYYIKNESEYTVKDITMKSSNDELVVLEHPQRLGPNGVKEFIVQWKPSMISISLDSVLEINGTMIVK